MSEVSQILSIDVLSPPASGAFTLGTNLVGDALTAPGVTSTWSEYMCDTASVQIERGGSNEAIVPSLDVGTTTVSWYGVLPDQLIGELQPGYRIRARNGDSRVFTGVIDGVTWTRDRRDPDDPKRNVTITASDAVKKLANKTRYGAVASGGVGHETWIERVARLSNNVSVPIEQPTDEQLSARSNYPTATATIDEISGGAAATLLTRRTTGSSRGVIFRTIGVSTGTNLTGRYGFAYLKMNKLTVGKDYVINMRVVNNSAAPVTAFASYVEDHGYVGFNCPPTSVLLAPGNPAPFWAEGVTVTRRFTATSVAMELRVATSIDMDITYDGTSPYAGSPVAFTVQPTLYVVLPETEVQDVALESSYKDHYDLVTTSAHAVWWVDAEGIVRFAKDPTEPNEVAHFDDNHDGDDPLHVCYSDLVEEYSTANIVNNLTVENHGRNSTTGDTDDTTTLFTSDTSEVTFGAQEQTIDTCIYDAGLWAGSMAVLAADLLIANDTPAEIVREISYDVLAYPGIEKTMDVYSKVFVYDVAYIVVGVSHDITPDSWQSTLTLRKAVES